MTTFTNPHERIEQLMQLVEALEAALRQYWEAKTPAAMGAADAVAARLLTPQEPKPPAYTGCITDSDDVPRCTAETPEKPQWHSEGSKVLGEMAEAYAPKSEPQGKQVGCEDEEGLLVVHPESETCHVCHAVKTNVNLCKHKGCKLSAGYGGEYCDEHL